jgi:hypothetical protein
MFDLRNFGDLLFPLIAAQRLATMGLETIAVSPSGHKTGLADAAPSIPLRELLAGEIDCAGIVVGGGYIIHCHPISFLENYAAEGLTETAGTGLWLGATLAAAVRDIPIVWNAPGVPHPLPQSRRVLAAAALRASDYVSLRDRGSAELIQPPNDVEVSLVPDPVAGIARLWDRRTLDRSFHQFLKRKARTDGDTLFVLHARDRSLATVGVAGIAARVDEFAREQRMTPVLVAVGQSHDDDKLARKIAGALHGPHILMDDPESLIEIASVIANSRLYMGSSLHGYIVAAAYDVPGILVARPSYRKFSGFLEHTGRMADLVLDWPEAFVAARGRTKEKWGIGIPAKVHDALDTHWRRIGEGLACSERRRAQRHGFLRAWAAQGMRIANIDWACLPFSRAHMLNG